jgi:hypothetical protein
MRPLSTPLDSIRRPVAAMVSTQPQRPVVIDTLVDSAGEVLAETGCTMLLIERIVREAGTTIRVDAIAADGSRIKGIARSGDPTMRTLCHAANAVLRALAGTMEDAGAADRVGIMTDGAGVLFSPDRPSVCGDDWLGAVLTGAAATFALTDFDPQGRWARLAAAQQAGEAH